MPTAAHLVQLYDVVRTVHLERVRGRRGPTTVLFRSTRYDFDESVAAQVNLVRAGVVASFLYGVRRPVDIIEINEPLIARAAPRSLAIIAGNRLRTLLRRESRAIVVTYAIASLDPWTTAGRLPLKARIKWVAQSTLIPAVWSRVDRIAYGTELARDIYDTRFGRRRRAPLSRMFPALPVAAADPGRHVPGRLVFLGDLSARKGFDVLMDAWPAVREAMPHATLTLIGKGSGRARARELAAVDPRVRFVEDPARAVIFDELRLAQVLTLPSQPMPLWREQVGLPIVEGLSFGCTIVTTEETGLASWLSEHGHYVVRPPDDAHQLGIALMLALDAARSARSVQHDLPDVDGREAAAQWLEFDNGEAVK